MEKGANAGNKHFLILLQCFLPYKSTKSGFSCIYVVCKCFQFGSVQNFVVWFGINTDCGQQARLKKPSFLALLFLEKTWGIAMALTLSLLSSSVKNFEILLYLCYFLKYLLETLSICSLSNNPYYQGRKFKMLCFFQNYAPFLTQPTYPLSSTQQLSHGTHM